MIYIKTIFEDNKEEWVFNHVLNSILYYDMWLSDECEFVIESDEWSKLTDDSNSQVYASNGEDDEVKKMEADINLYREYFDWWIVKNNAIIKDTLRAMFWDTCEFINYEPFEPEKRHYLSYRTIDTPVDWYVNVLSFDSNDNPTDPNNPGFDLIEVKSAEKVKEILGVLLESYLEKTPDKELFDIRLTYCGCPAEIFLNQLPEFKIEKGEKNDCLH